MSDLQEITIVEDDSVERTIAKVATKLNSKYSKKRKVNEWILKELTGVKKVVSVLLNILFVIVIFCAGLLTISCIVSRANGTIPTFAGYSLMHISSGSMEASGFEVGENIVVKAVNTDTLRVGDDIAFYVYDNSYNDFDLSNVDLLDLEDTDAKTNITFANFFGFQSQAIKEAANAGSRIVFHQIYAIYEDENGERWFETKGTSNAGIDVWRINEVYVIGIYDDSGFGHTMALILNSLTNNSNFLLLLMIPFAIFTLLIVYNIVRDLQKAKLELDVVEEKRKLTDDICVKYGIGYSMDTKTKYKVLAQANDEEKQQYISLLWKDGSAPSSIRKYVIKKQLYLSGMKKLLNLNRECEKMFKDGEKPNDIAKYYIKEKEKILNEQSRKEKRVRDLRKKMMDTEIKKEIIK